MKLLLFAALAANIASPAAAVQIPPSDSSASINLQVPCPVKDEPKAVHSVRHHVLTHRHHIPIKHKAHKSYHPIHHRIKHEQAKCYLAHPEGLVDLTPYVITDQPVADNYIPVAPDNNPLQTWMDTAPPVETDEASWTWFGGLCCCDGGGSIGGYGGGGIGGGFPTGPGNPSGPSNPGMPIGPGGPTNPGNPSGPGMPSMPNPPIGPPSPPIIPINPVSAVPEPNTWELMIIAFGLVGYVFREQKKKPIKN